MGNKNIWILAVLILLTIGSYVFSELSGEASRVDLLIFFALLKVSLVAFYFMELKKAHRGWWMILGLVFVVYSGFLLALNI